MIGLRQIGNLNVNEERVPDSEADHVEIGNRATGIDRTAIAKLEKKRRTGRTNRPSGGGK